MEIRDYIQASASLLTFIGVWLAFLQLRRVSRSLRLNHQGNTVTVISHCASRYEKIMAELPPIGNQDAEAMWWYRYWDLLTEEFNFFRKSLLDPDIFELWINELATVYRSSPQAGMRTRAETHRQYLTSTLPCYPALHEFYNQVGEISAEPNAEARARQVHKLVMEFAPTTEFFEITLNK